MRLMKEQLEKKNSKIGRCPKCNALIMQDCCVKCGYMNNGNTVKYTSKEPNVFDDLRLLDPYFDKIYHNDNSWMPFILGLLYLVYCGHFIIGIIGGVLEFGFFMLFSNVIGQIAQNNLFIYSSLIIYFAITRFLCAGFLNVFSIWLDKKKIEKLKTKYPVNYKVYLLKKIKGWRSIVLSITIYIIVIVIIFIYKRVKNGIF